MKFFFEQMAAKLQIIHHAFELDLKTFACFVHGIELLVSLTECGSIDPLL